MYRTTIFQTGSLKATIMIILFPCLRCTTKHFIDLLIINDLDRRTTEICRICSR